MLKYVNLYEKHEWEYFLSKKVVDVKQSKQKNNVY